MTETPALDGKVVAITGGARGIGAATATLLTERGARVAIGDLDPEVTEATATRIGGATRAYPLDVTDTASLTSFLDAVEADLGPLDVMVNNAGIMPISTALDEDDTTTARILDVNLRAVIVGSREAARRMVPRGRGHVVNVASTAGKAGLVGLSTYCASKAGVIAYSEALEQELADQGVHVTAILPGIVKTELAVGVPQLRGVPSITPESVAEGIAQAIVAPRFEVYVPRQMGPLLAGARLLPHRAGLWLSRTMGATDIFLDATKHPDRDAYEARARGRSPRS